MNLDEMIMEVEVNSKPPAVNKKETRIQVKFLAIAGGNGPQFTMERSLAETLYTKLGAILHANSLKMERESK